MVANSLKAKSIKCIRVESPQFLKLKTIQFFQEMFYAQACYWLSMRTEKNSIPFEFCYGQSCVISVQSKVSTNYNQERANFAGL